MTPPALPLPLVSLQDGEEEQPAARCQFVGNSSSHSRSSSALERSRKGLVGPPAATCGPSTKAGGLGGSLFWLALLAGAAALWSGIYLQVRLASCSCCTDDCPCRASQPLDEGLT